MCKVRDYMKQYDKRSKECLRKEAGTWGDQLTSYIERILEDGGLRKTAKVQDD